MQRTHRQTCALHALTELSVTLYVLRLRGFESGLQLLHEVGELDQLAFLPRFFEGRFLCAPRFGGSGFAFVPVPAIEQPANVTDSRKVWPVIAPSLECPPDRVRRFQMKLAQNFRL
jgi:hypothetical protein